MGGGIVSAGIIVFLQAVSATAAWAIGLFFFRFWRQTHDRLFALFGIAFWLLALSWSLLAISGITDERRPYVYAIRLLAFLLIIVATVDKNRQGR
jgi:hypothetical protein